jgi:DNA-binding CsgD family transcriptional regulator
MLSPSCHATRTTVAELERLAAVCAQLSLDGDEHTLAARLVDPLGDLLGAESAVYRVFTLDHAAPGMTQLVSRGVSTSVTDAYLGRYHRLDPALGLLGHTRAPSSSDFIRYRNEFLVPNGMVHHVGFSLQDAPGRRLLLFNFHRTAASAPFGALEEARARLLRLSLQGKVHECGWAHVAALDSGDPLSVREREVAQAVAAGLTNKHVALQLGISVRTVENHLRAIYAKLQIANRSRLIALLNRAR